MNRRHFIFGAAALLGSRWANASQDPLMNAMDHYREQLTRAEKTAGYLGPRAYIPEAVKVTEGVYTVVGSLIWHNPSNYGLNNNLSFMIFEDGVFVFNGGANPALAKALHEQIKKHTNKPVKWVAVENHQGHAHLGASYWYDMGVRNFYSNRQAYADFSASWDIIKQRWSDAVGFQYTQGAHNISEEYITFDDEMEIDVGGGEKVSLHYFGPGHTPGSAAIYVPSRNVIFPGDLAYNTRMLALFNYTDTFKWVKSFETFMDFTPEGTIIVPGHGGPTDMATVKRDTYDYLVWLQTEVKKVIESGGDLADAERIDQSAYKDRPVFDQTWRANSRHVYEELTR